MVVHLIIYCPPSRTVSSSHQHPLYSFLPPSVFSSPPTALMYSLTPFASSLQLYPCPQPTEPLFPHSVHQDIGDSLVTWSKFMSCTVYRSILHLCTMYISFLFYVFVLCRWNCVFVCTLPIWCILRNLRSYCIRLWILMTTSNFKPVDPEYHQCNICN